MLKSDIYKQLGEGIIIYRIYDFDQYYFSAVHYDAGAKTPIAGVISAIVMGITLLFLTSLFYYLPLAVLASIVTAAAISLIDYEAPIRLWKVSKIETGLLLLAFFLTLFLGVEIGVLTAVGACLVHVIFISSRPHTAVLGRLPGTVVYRNIARFFSSNLFHILTEISGFLKLWFIQVLLLFDSMVLIFSQMLILSKKNWKK
jgi:MFS superfamily sulfate permease-like transporter